MIKLVAVGNRFMKDDGIGIKVAEELMAKNTDLKIDIIIGETDYQSSFYSLGENDVVILLDAVYIGSEPGSVHIIDLRDALSQPSNIYMQHEMSVIEFMRLYNCKFNGCIIGIEAAEVEFGDELSLVLKEKFNEIYSKTETVIKNIIMERKSHA